MNKEIMTKVRLTYLPRSMTEQFYRYKMTNNSWQGWEAGNQTFTDEDLEKVDVQEIRELMAEDNDESPLLPDG